MKETDDILTFDPGGTTGVAIVSSEGDILFTAAMPFDVLRGFIHVLEITGWPGSVAVEKEPKWGHNSPITKRATALILIEFPDAILVQPSQWKSHPASKRNGAYRYATRHEKDAVGIARWFHATRSSRVKEGQSGGHDSSRTNAASSRR